MLTKKAYFRFEASPTMGAGHAIRSCVIADALNEEGWSCFLVTSDTSYEFIPDLKRFNRINPEDFYTQPVSHDLLIIDHYDLDITYEQYFRRYAKKILVIDDLANRKHECDILLDQTYGRTSQDYKHLVPENCQILTGSDYVLLRREFIEMRPKALEKRRHTKEIERILVSMGGSDPGKLTLKALEMIKESGFKGEIDIVLGFQENGKDAILAFLKDMPNLYRIHVNPNMVQLMYDADVAIGAAGSSVWERCCLGLPQVVMQAAENQSEILKIFPYHIGESFSNYDLIRNKQKKIFRDIDGLGFIRFLQTIKGYYDSHHKPIALNKIKEEDMNWVYECHKTPKLREFSFNKNVPSYEDHKRWFQETIEDPLCVFEKILCGNEPCGTLRLNFDLIQNSYVLSWYVLLPFQNRGIGTIAVNLAKDLVDKKIIAFAFSENYPSHKALKKSGFLLRSQEKNGIWYEH